MGGHEIVVVGASAGGVEALKDLVSLLPADLPAAIFVVLHMPPRAISALPQILSRAGKLPAVHAQHNQLIEPGHIYVAPPDQHLLLKPGHIVLTRGPTENGHRPGIDPLFRTAARAYGTHVVGIVLSGVLDDGTAGLIAVKLRGGIAIAQHPEDAMFSAMPLSAIENVNVDYIASTSEIAALIPKLAILPALSEDEYPLQDSMEAEAHMAELDELAIQEPERRGSPSGFACPDCGGALFEVEEGGLLRFRCRVGHAYGSETLLAKQSDALEEALWIALRALEESAALSRRLFARFEQRGSDNAAKRFATQAQEAEERANIVRNVLLNGTLSTLVNRAGETP